MWGSDQLSSVEPAGLFQLMSGIRAIEKSLGSANPHNVLKACVNGLKSQNSPKILSAIRGKKISDIVMKREAK